MGKINIDKPTIKIFNQTLKMAQIFSNSQQPSVYEIAHYIIDNLIGKISMVYAKSIGENIKNSKNRTKVSNLLMIENKFFKNENIKNN